MVQHLISLDGGQTVHPNFTSAELAAMDEYYYSTSYEAVILVTLSFFALIISIPGLSLHIKNKSLPASCMVGWIVLLNLTNIINALVWPNDNIDAWWDGQIYCDIDIKIDIASTMGLIGALTCIMRSLAQALDTTNIRLMPSKAQRIRQQVLSIGLCIGLPLLVAVLHFILQPIRYYIFAIAGCKASFSSSWYALLLGTIWPPVLCLVSSFYSCLLAIRIYRYRRDFSTILSNSSTGLNKSRFLRLFISALTVLLVVLPLQAYALYINIANGIDDVWTPTSWQVIVYVPTGGIVFPDRWVRVGIAFPVFLCFGWGKDANSIYKSWLRLLGLTRLFPSLANTTPTTTHRPHGNPSSSSHSGAALSRSSTLFSKARTLLSSTRKASTSSEGTFSSLSSQTDSAPHGKRNGDLESQMSAVELIDRAPTAVTMNGSIGDVSLHSSSDIPTHGAVEIDGKGRI